MLRRPSRIRVSISNGATSISAERRSASWRSAPSGTSAGITVMAKAGMFSTKTSPSRPKISPRTGGVLTVRMRLIVARASNLS